MDVLVRMENGEFIVMLPGKTQAEAGQVLKRMRITISHCVVPLKDREFILRFQHGIAELMPNETAQGVLSRARQGLSEPTRNAAAAPNPKNVERARNSQRRRRVVFFSRDMYSRIILAMYAALD